MSAELAPCPFCGGHPVTTEAMGEHWVSCGTCTASATMKGKLKEACDAWNRRTPPAMSADHIGEATNMVAPMEAVAWRVKDYADGWILFHHEAPARKSGEARNGALVQPLYAHPAPIKPSVDTGELRERVAEAKEWIDEAECRRGCSTWRPDVHGRSRCDCGREAAADAILDLIQSERAGSPIGQNDQPVLAFSDAGEP